MHSMMMWPFLTVTAAALVVVPTIGDSSHRSLVYWLVIPPLLAGVLAVCSRLAIW
jgi:hypothetical protein